MANGSELELLAGEGTFQGFSNFFQKENRNWWQDRSPLVRAGIWLVLIDGLLILSLFILPNLAGPGGEPLIPEDPLEMGSQMFTGITMIALAIGIVILLQDTIIEELQSDTAGWVLSKPISRKAFILAKLVSHSVGMLIQMILLPSLIAYGLFWIYEPSAITIGDFIATVFVICVHTLFYLTLTILIGVISKNRSIVLSIALVSIFGGGFVAIPELVQFFPWQLPQIGLLILQGKPVDTMGLTMIGATLLWSFAFSAVAVQQFGRVEL
jgi:ABC-2 type transport system permease protein